MPISSHRIVVTTEAVYQPPPSLWLSAALFLALVVGVAIFLLCSQAGRNTPWSLFIPLGFAAGFLIRSVLEHRRYGSLGKPRVFVAEGLLGIASPRGDMELRLALATLEKLVVYGQEGRRIYRLVKLDGTYLEARPEWGPKVERAAIAFMQNALGSRVVVEAPQTAFAAARGDGPYYGT